MDAKSTSRTKALLLVLGIFVIGFSAGALSMNLYATAGIKNNGHMKPPVVKPPDYMLIQMTKQLSLDTDQQEKIKAIITETFDQYKQLRHENEPRVDAIRQKSREKMRAVLKPEQIPQFETMCLGLDKKREEFEKEKK